jgi:Tfp pilus assembly protein PilX
VLRILQNPALRLFRRLARREQGMALVLALGMSVVLGSAGTTAMMYSTQDLTHAKRSDGEMRSFALAESALNDALSTLYNSSSPTQPGAVPAASQQVDGGTMTWWGTLDTTTNVWTLTGTGSVPSPAHAAPIVRTVKAAVSLASSTHGSSNNAVWNYLYSDATTGCMSVGNSVNVNVPLYVRGNLCMSNSATFTGYQLEVGGSLSFSNSSHVGTPTNTPVHDVHIAGTCSGCSNNIYSQQPWDTQTAPLTKPPVDLAGWYQNAQPGPKHGCTQGSFPGGFDTNNVMDGSRGTVDLAPSQPYDCKVLDAQGNLVGEIGYTPGNPGTLTIAGTIFIDGNISFANLNNIVYQGRATIYASGTVTISNQTTICGVAGCNSNWDANQNLLAFVAGSSTAPTSFSIANNSTFQGAVYAVNDYNEGNSVTMWGPVIARQLFVANSTQNHYVPIGTLMPGMPATYYNAVSLSDHPTGWSS